MMPTENKATPIRPAQQLKAAPLVYRINDATEKLGVSRNTIYRLVNRGELELVKVGARASGITAKSINEFLGKGQQAQ